MGAWVKDWVPVSMYLEERVKAGVEVRVVIGVRRRAAMVVTRRREDEKVRK